MAVEIKELVIHAEVDYQPAGENEQDQIEEPSMPELDMDAIVEACVKRVMKIMKQNQQR
jgi:hypothetical protein